MKNPKHIAGTANVYRFAAGGRVKSRRRQNDTADQQFMQWYRALAEKVRQQLNATRLNSESTE